MGSFKKLENDFTGGQVSPLLNKRSNAKRHDIGLKTLQNMTIMLQGGVTSRPSTEHVAQVKDSSKETRLLPFEFSTEETYAIEMGDQYFRFLKESGQVLESDITVTDISQANPGVITTSGSHGLTAGEQFYLTEVVGMTEVNHTRVYYTVGTTTSNTLQLKDQDNNNVDTTGLTAYSSGGVINKVYEIVATYLEADLSLIQYTQSADVISLVHEDYAPKDLTRTADTSWTITDTTFIDGPYLTENTTTTTLTASGTSGSITITASSTVGINSGSGFLSSDIGRLVRIGHGDPVTWGNATITAVGSTTSITVTTNEDITNTTATEVWRLGSWSDTTGYPRTVTYHQQRRIYAGTPTQPDTIWGSAIDDFTNFIPGVDDSDSIEYIVSSNKVNAIYWLASSSRLRVGTSGGIHTLWGGSTVSSLTPTNVEADEENQIKCKRIQPIQNGNVTLFAQRSGKVLRELVFDFQVDGLVAPDITLVSEDILGSIGDSTDNGVIRMAFQLEPTPTIWCAKDNGELAALTYSRETDTVGWHNHIIGGTDVTIKDVVSIPGTGQDRVWVIVSRTINGVTRQYMEQLSAHFRGSVNREAAFSDSHVHFTGEEPTATLTPAATTGTGINFTAGSPVFTSTDVGRIIQYKNGDSVYSRALITAFANSTVVVVTILRDFPNTSAIASGSWTLSTTDYKRLDHLEGETVSILADGGTQPSQVVTNNQIILSGQYTDVIIGLGYIQEIELLDIDFGSAVGTAYSARSKVNEVNIDLFESMGGFIGYDEDSLREIIYSQGNRIMNEGNPLFTGSKTPRPKGGWRDSIKTLIRQTDPLPLTVLGIVVKGEVSDSTG